MKQLDPNIIDELLVSYLLEEGTAENRSSVESWIDETEANRKYFDNFKLIWVTSQEISLPAEIDERAAWQRFLHRVDQGDKKPAVVRQMTSSFSRFRIAAGIVLIAGALSVAYLIWDRTSNARVSFASGDISRSDTLPDGSVITLNKNSEISYAGRLRGRERAVSLKGEAFFTVTPDKKKPFVVQVNDVTITVVGTSFNVKSLNGKTEVIVESGVVKVKRRNQERILRKGQEVVAGARDSISNPVQTADLLYNYYRTNEFVCDGTPLWKLVAMLNEVYDSNIIIDKESLRNLPLTTTFANESLDNVLGVIKETFDITIERRKDAIILR